MWGLHCVMASHLLSAQAFASQNEETPYVKGLENPSSECSWISFGWLVKHGYSDTEIEKLVGGNALRVLQRIGY